MSPSVAPENSATVAPMTANPTATRSPTKICGSAAGTRTFTKVCRRDADSERASSASSPGVEVNPATAETTIGKKHTRNTSTTRDTWPRPNQTSTSGASATFGTAFAATSSGVNIRSTTRELATASAMASPPTTASAYPSSVSTVEARRCPSRSRGESTNTRATSSGVGRMIGWMRKAITLSHHTAMSTTRPRIGRTTAPSRPGPRPVTSRGPRTRPDGLALGGQVEVDQPVRRQAGRDGVGPLHQRDAAGHPLLVQRADRGAGPAGVHVLLHQGQLAGRDVGVLRGHVAVQDLPGLLRVVHRVLQRLEQRRHELLDQLGLLLGQLGRGDQHVAVHVADEVAVGQDDRLTAAGRLLDGGLAHDELPDAVDGAGGQRARELRRRQVDELHLARVHPGELGVGREHEADGGSGGVADGLALQVLRGRDVVALQRHDRREGALVDGGHGGDTLDLAVADLDHRTGEVDRGEVDVARGQLLQVRAGAFAGLDRDVDPGVAEVPLVDPGG